MQYRIVLASRPMVKPSLMETMPFVPGTEQTMVFDTESGICKEVWLGYLNMREVQKAHKLDDDDWVKIKVTEVAAEITQIKEAVNIFNRYMVGTSRDNCLCVKSIEVIVEPDPLDNISGFDKRSLVGAEPL